MTAKELRERRATLIAEARKLVDLAGTEKRDMSAEETEAFDKHWEEIETLKTDIDDAAYAEKRQRERIGQLEVAEQDLVASRGRQTQATQPGTGQPPAGPTEPFTLEYRGQRLAFEEGSPSHARSLPEYEQEFRGYLATGRESRALQMDSDTAGGYIVAPQQFIADLIKAVDNLVFFRQFATVSLVTNADSVGRPSLDNDPADPTWTAEIKTGDEDSTMDFGKRELQPHPLAKRLKVSRKLLRAAAIGVEPLVRDRLAYKFAVTMENAYLNGTGAQQPLGVFTASDDGISTGRDENTDNTNTTMTADNLIECKYKMKGQYWPRLRWIFHRDAIKAIAKFKDGDGQYIWKPGIVAADPDRLLNFPVMMSEYAPNTFTSGKYVGILGDFSQYWIADALSMEIQALFELYAETHQVGYIGRLESDGMPILEEAFVRVTLT